MSQARSDCPDDLPAYSGWLFPEYDFPTMTPESHVGVIIERILERGTWAQVRSLFARYGEERVARWVQGHGFRLLSKRAFALWRLVLGITAPTIPAWAVEARGMETW